MGTPLSWDTVEQAVKEISEHRDDFELVTLRVPGRKWNIGGTVVNGAFLEIQLCSGKRKLVDLGIAEALINDGILSRLRIPVKLDQSE